MSTVVADLLVKVGSDTRDAETGLERVNAAVRGAAKVSVAGGLAIAGGFVLAAKEAIGFQTQMNNINSIAHISQGELAGLGTQIEALAVKSGQGPTALANGLYQIQSAGFVANDALKILTTSTTAATAGLTTADVAADALTSAINAYGASASDADYFANIMFRTVDKGKLTFAQLASTIGDNVSLASHLGVSFEDLGAAYAVLTQKGVNYNEAATQINAIMSSFMKPSEALTAALHREGYETGELLLRKKGLTGALQLLEKAQTEYGYSLADLLPNIRAVRGVSALSSEAFAAMRKQMEDAQPVGDRLGAMQRALAEQTKSASYQIARMKSALAVVGIELGKVLLPAITKVASALTGLMKHFINLPDSAKKMIAIVGLVAAGLLIAAGALVLFGGLFAGIAASFITLGAVMAPVIAAFALFGNTALNVARMTIAAFKGDSTWKWTRELSPGLYQATEGLRKFATAAGQVARLMVQAFKEGTPVKKLVEELPAPLQNVGRGFLLVADAIGDLWSRFQSGGLGAVLDLLPSKLDQIWQGLKPIGEKAWGAFKEGVVAAAEGAFDLTFHVIPHAVSNITGRFFDWVLGELGFRSGGDKTGGPEMDNQFSKLDFTISMLVKLGKKLWDMGTDAASWVKAHILEGVHGAVDIGVVLINAAIDAGPTLQSWFDRFGAWVKQKIQQGATNAIDIGTVLIRGVVDPNSTVDHQGFVSRLGTSIGDAIRGSASMAADWGGAIVDKFRQIEWSTLLTVDAFHLGETVGAAIHNAIVATVGFAANVVSGVAGALSGADWSSAAKAIGSGLAGAVLSIPAAIVGLNTAILSFVAGALKGLVFGDAEVLPTIQSLSDGLIRTLNGAGRALFSGVGTAAVTGIATKIQEVVTVDNFDAAASAVAKAIWDATRNAIFNAVTSATDLLTDMRDALLDTIGNVDWAGLAASIGGAIWDALVQYAKDHFSLSDLWDAVKGKAGIGTGGKPPTPIPQAFVSPGQLGGLVGVGSSALNALKGGAISPNVDTTAAVSALRSFQTIVAVTMAAATIAVVVFSISAGNALRGFATTATTMGQLAATNFLDAWRNGLLMAQAVTILTLALIGVQLTVFTLRAIAAGLASGLGFVNALRVGLAGAVGVAASAALGAVLALSGYDGLAFLFGLSLGVSFGQGVAAGINSQLFAIAAAGAAAAQAAMTAAANVIRPGSPSRAAIELFATIPAGAVKALGDGVRDVAAAGSDLAAAAFGGVGSATPVASSRGNTIVYDQRRFVALSASDLQKLLEQSGEAHEFAVSLGYEMGRASGSA